MSHSLVDLKSCQGARDAQLIKVGLWHLHRRPRNPGISEAVAMAVGSFAGYSAMRALREAAGLGTPVGPNNHGFVDWIWLILESSWERVFVCPQFNGLVEAFNSYSCHICSQIMTNLRSEQYQHVRTFGCSWQGRLGKATWIECRAHFYCFAGRYHGAQAPQQLLNSMLCPPLVMLTCLFMVNENYPPKDSPLWIRSA